MAGDEKADFAGRESMVSQLFVVVEVSDDGLCRTPGISEYKPTNSSARRSNRARFWLPFPVR